MLTTIGVVTPYRRIALQNLLLNKNKNRTSRVMRALIIHLAMSASRSKLQLSS